MSGGRSWSYKLALSFPITTYLQSPHIKPCSLSHVVCGLFQAYQELPMHEFLLMSSVTMICTTLT